MTVDWLCTTRPVLYTGRTANQICLADPFFLFQQCVKQNAHWWTNEYVQPDTGKKGYTPNPESKTGLPGTRAPAYADWRDNVLLEALRIFRARMEGASLETVRAPSRTSVVGSAVRLVGSCDAILRWLVCICVADLAWI